MPKYKVIQDDAYDCVENIIATIASWWNRNYELMFLDLWNFDFFEDASEKKIGDRIIMTQGKESKLLEEYHGIKIKSYNTKNASEVLSIAKKINPLVVYLDAYWNPWNNSYQKFHFPHYLITIGFNNKELYCVDPHFGIEEAFLPMVNFVQGCGSCFSLSIVNSDNKTIDWIEKFGKIIHKLNTNKMIIFAKELSKLNNLNNELKYYDAFWMTPIFLNVEKISRNRRKFAELIRYILINYNVKDLKGIYERMYQLGAEWKTIYYSLYKATISNNCTDIIKRISNKIINMAYEEQVLADDLLYLCVQYKNK